MSKKRTPASNVAYTVLLADVKARIQQAQTRAILAVNAELVRHYWDIGRVHNARQAEEGLGPGVIPRLVNDLKNDLPEVKGFSERNIDRMIRFFRAYPDPASISPQPVANLNAPPISQQAAAKTPQHVAKLPDSLVWSVPWAHHVILLEKVKNLYHRIWYMQQTLTQGWSRNILSIQIAGDSVTRHGTAVTNFAAKLLPPQSDLAQQSLKDPYIFDFLTLTEPFQERELESELVGYLEKFLLELCQGFAFVGRQYRLNVGNEDFYIDLLFYHLWLRAFIVIDLKKGAFKTEYAGKLNFYGNVVNDKLKHPTDAPTIGLILCQSKDNVLAEYSFAGIDKPIGISTHELTRALPPSLQSALPTVEQIEVELAETETPTQVAKTSRKKSGGRK